jgi:hypothetical protein
MNTTENKLMLLQNLLSIKAAELELKSRELKAILLNNEVNPSIEAEFKGQVSELMHQVGMIEDASVWKHYCTHVSHEFESELSIISPFFRPMKGGE